MVLQQLLTLSCDNKIIRVANKIYHRSIVIFLRAVYRKAIGKQFFQSVQSHICKSWGDDAALRSSLLCRKKLLVENKSTFQPFTEQNFIHRDIVKQPFMTDMVETTFDITF